jgi:hypothetical protein
MPPAASAARTNQRPCGPLTSALLSAYCERAFGFETSETLMHRFLIAGLMLTLFGQWGYPAEDKEALEYGRIVQAVNRYLEYRLPPKPTAADKKKAEEIRQAAVSAGHSTAMYKWVRSRLEFEETTLESLLRDTHPTPTEAKELRAQIDDLHKVIYEIDAPR